MNVIHFIHIFCTVYNGLSLFHVPISKRLQMHVSCVGPNANAMLVTIASFHNSEQCFATKITPTTKKKQEEKKKKIKAKDERKAEVEIRSDQHLSRNRTP